MEKTPRERQLESALRKIAAVILVGAGDPPRASDKAVLAIIKKAFGTSIIPIRAGQPSKAKLAKLKKAHKKHPRA